MSITNSIPENFIRSARSSIVDLSLQAPRYILTNNRMTINDDYGRRFLHSRYFIISSLLGPPPKMIKERSQSSSSHMKRELLIFLSQPALLIIVLHLVNMDKVICTQYTNIRKDLRHLTDWEELLQGIQYLFRGCLDQSVLAILKNRDIILGILTEEQMITLVGNKSRTENNLPNTFTDFLPPLFTGDLNSVIYTHNNSRRLTLFQYMDPDDIY